MSAVVIVGGGPGGLAVAAALRRVGVEAVILEREASVGARWRRHYDRLHLHTTRRLSGLPGLAIPRAYGRWVHRDDVVRYLEAYALHHDLRVETGVAVERIERSTTGWRVVWPGGAREAERVVVATGYSNVPYLPDWPGRAGFTGQLLHSSAYRKPGPFLGKHVLVVGTGNSGAEIACDLAEHGLRVGIAVRTPPNILPRQVAFVPTQALGILLRPLPPSVVDPVVAVFERLTIGSLARHGLPRPPRGAYTQVREGGVLPILDVGFVRALARKQIAVHPGVEGFDGPEVLLAGGARLRPDVVVAATGYRRGLEPLVGHLGVLDEKGGPRHHGAATDPRAPGLHFVGYTNPVSGNLRELALQARRIARLARRKGRGA